MACGEKHVHTVAAIACRFEFTPGGCTNQACGFKHQLPRDNGELQKKLAVLLAERDSDKLEEAMAVAPGDSGDPAPAKCSDDDDELDLDALRAQALSSVTGQVKKKAVKRKKDETDDNAEEKDEKKKKTSDIRSRLGPRVTSTTATGIQRRVITTKSEYSEDEVSDLSMDELTDEEPPEEDLRATLNKNKTKAKTVTVTKKTDQKQRLIRKINVMSPKKESHSRLITLRQVTNGQYNNSSESRPSSSEWIERKIRVKQPIMESEDYSDNSELPSDTEQQQEPKVTSKKPKRKPNLAWVGLCQNESTEESDLFKRKTSSDQSSGGEFTNRRITVQNDHCKSGINARLGVKSSFSSSQSVKSRLGGGVGGGGGKSGNVKLRLGKKDSSPIKPKVVSLKREIYHDPFEPTKSDEQEEQEEPLVKKRAEPKKQEATKMTVKEPVKSATTQLSTTATSNISKDRLNSTLDLEAALLNSDGSDLDDLELGGDIDDDELFA